MICAGQIIKYWSAYYTPWLNSINSILVYVLNGSLYIQFQLLTCRKGCSRWFYHWGGWEKSPELYRPGDPLHACDGEADNKHQKQLICVIFQVS